MTCPRCGAVNDPNTPACIVCGFSFVGSAVPPAAAGTAPTVGAPVAGGVPPYRASSPYPYEGPFVANAPPPVVSMPATMSGLAIAGLVCAFLCAPLGFILSLIALSQISRSLGGLRGRGLAIAGIVISLLNFFGWLGMRSCPAVRHRTRIIQGYHASGAVEEPKALSRLVAPPSGRDVHGQADSKKHRHERGAPVAHERQRHPDDGQEARHHADIEKYVPEDQGSHAYAEHRAEPVPSLTGKGKNPENHKKV